MVAADSRFVDYDIYLVNYRTPLFKNAPNIYETAGSELSHLKDGGAFKQYTDLHFIGHSMGGLVLKSMLLRLTSGPNVNMLRQVKSVIYLSTPAQGASIASLVSRFSMNPQLTDMERAHLNTFIQNLEDGWVQLMISRDEAKARFPRVHCAYETLETNGVFVVPREMANTRCDDILHSMPFNHFGMVTPTRRDADPYLWVMTRILEATTENEMRKEAAGMFAQAERLRSSGEAQQARLLYKEAGKLFQKVADRLGEAQVLRGLGDVDRGLGRNDEAREAYTQAGTLFQKTEDRLGEAQVLRGLGELERMLGRNDKAREAYSQASILYKKMDDRHGEAQVLLGLADLERTLGHSKQAGETLTEARTLYEELKSRLGEAQVLLVQGALEYALGRDDQARKAYSQARTIFQAEKYRLGEAQVLSGLGDLERELGRNDQAREALTEAGMLYKELKSRRGEADILLGLGDLERTLSRNDEARKAYSRASTLFKEVEDRRGEAYVLVGLGRLEVTLHHAELARQHLYQAAGLFEAIGMSDWKEIALTEAKNLSR
jgi:tetratricopeptide (TPR) repeat protein